MFGFKKLVFGLLAVAATNILAVDVNRDGNLGIDRTSSAKLLEKGQMTLGFHSQVTNDGNMIKDATFVNNGVPYTINHYTSLNSSVFVGMGLGMADLSLALPIYYEGFQGSLRKVPGVPVEQQYQGDLRYRLKVPVFTTDDNLSFAILTGGSLPTQRAHKGMFPQEREYFSENIGNSDITPWTSGSPTFMVTGLMTKEFNPYVRAHANLGLRNVNFDGLHNVVFTSAAVEVDPLSYLGLFGELYHETYLTQKQVVTVKPTTLAFGAILRSGFGLDLYGGAQFAYGSEYTAVKYNAQGSSAVNSYSIRSVPTSSLLLQLSWTLPNKKAPKPAPVVCPTCKCPAPVVCPPVPALPPNTLKDHKAFILRGVNFNTDSWVLLPESYDILNKVLPILLENPDMDIEVSGHTDIRASLKYNVVLSYNRAQAVADYFVSKGVKNKLVVKGYNYSRPIATNKTEEGMWLNRRVELIWINEKK